MTTLVEGLTDPRGLVAESGVDSRQISRNGLWPEDRDLAPPEISAGISLLIAAAFLLDTLVVSLVLGHVVHWLVSMPVVEPERLSLLACHGIVAGAFVLSRLPALLFPSQDG